MSNLEHIDGKLVVDELIIDPSLPNHIVVRIGAEFYMLPNSIGPETVRGEDLRPYKKTPDASWYRPTGAWQYWSHGLIPRGGYQIEIGRPIAAAEWEQLVAEHELTEDDISPVFSATVGSIYGRQFERSYPARQIRLKSVPEAIRLERTLREKGIEAANVAPERVNIRVETPGE